jgi:8-oxo-dGTP diphosphatase
MTDSRNKMRFVVALIFDGDDILLIRKLRPAFLRGLLNGPGGKMEGGETHHEAASREVKEETSLDIPRSSWKEVACLHGHSEAFGGDYAVFVVAAEHPLAGAAALTDEPLVIAKWGSLPHDVTPNIRWLVPLAKDTEVAGPAEVVIVRREVS